MRKGLIIILSFFGGCLYAQDVFNRPQPPTSFTEDLRAIDFIQRNVLSQIRTSGPNAIENDEIMGSAYLEDQFKAGTVFYNDTRIGDYLLRYNVYGEEFEVLNDDTTKSAVNKTSEVHVTVGIKNYVFKYFTDDDEKSRFGYFEVLSDAGNSHCTLLRKNKKLLSESRRAVTSFDVTRPARFVDTETYYLLFDDKEIVKIRLQNSYISRFFKKRGIDVKTFLKENDLNVKNVEDLKKVIHHCDSLLQ
ncbi:MAG: hypothetical protein KDD04_01230 [Sinomicrobium sp.]|nr:hypothetical protein [Sinomicrobium sp.]